MAGRRAQQPTTRTLLCNTTSSSAGQAILMVVLTMMVGLTIALVIFTNSLAGLRNISTEEASERAFNAAEAGIEEALLKSDAEITGDFNVTLQENISATVQVAKQNAFNQKVKKNDAVTVMLKESGSEEPETCWSSDGSTCDSGCNTKSYTQETVYTECNAAVCGGGCWGDTVAGCQPTLCNQKTVNQATVYTGCTSAVCSSSGCWAYNGVCDCTAPSVVSHTVYQNCTGSACAGTNCWSSDGIACDAGCMYSSTASQTAYTSCTGSNCGGNCWSDDGGTTCAGAGLCQYSTMNTVTGYDTCTPTYCGWDCAYPGTGTALTRYYSLAGCGGTIVGYARSGICAESSTACYYTGGTQPYVLWKSYNRIGEGGTTCTAHDSSGNRYNIGGQCVGKMYSYAPSGTQYNEYVGVNPCSSDGTPPCYTLYSGDARNTANGTCGSAGCVQTTLYNRRLCSWIAQKQTWGVSGAVTAYTGSGTCSSNGTGSCYKLTDPVTPYYASGNATCSTGGSCTASTAKNRTTCTWIAGTNSYTASSPVTKYTAGAGTCSTNGTGQCYKLTPNTYFTGNAACGASGCPSGTFNDYNACSWQVTSTQNQYSVNPATAVTKYTPSNVACNSDGSGTCNKLSAIATDYYTGNSICGATDCPKSSFYDSSTCSWLPVEYQYTVAGDPLNRYKPAGGTCTTTDASCYKLSNSNPLDTGLYYSSSSGCPGSACTTGTYYDQNTACSKIASADITSVKIFWTLSDAKYGEHTSSSCDSENGMAAGLMIEKWRKDGEYITVEYIAKYPAGCATDSSSVGFTPASASTNPTYLNEAEVSIDGLDQYLVIRPLFNDATIEVVAQGGLLPGQQYEFISTGKVPESGESRAIKVVKSMPMLPGIFDYALYSGGIIKKEDD